MTQEKFFDRIHPKQIPTLSQQEAISFAKPLNTINPSENISPHHLAFLKYPPVKPPLPDWAQKIKDFGFHESRPTTRKDV